MAGAYDLTKDLGLDGGKVIIEQLKAYADRVIAASASDKYLDQTKTTLVDNFAFTAAEYPGATDPNLNGKPVMVLAVRDSDGTEITYSFVNMTKLLDTYTAADASVTVSGRTIAAAISEDTDNALSLAGDGLKVTVATTAEVLALCNEVLGASE